MAIILYSNYVQYNCKWNTNKSTSMDRFLVKFNNSTESFNIQTYYTNINDMYNIQFPYEQ